MKNVIRSLASAAVIATAFAATGALAHAHLLKSLPTDGAVTAPPQMIMLTFSEKLADKLSGFEVVKADGGKVAAQVAVADGGKVLHAMPAKPLAPGVYKVNWGAVTDDGHRMTGTVTFTVK
jgi:hypothetical protein